MKLSNSQKKELLFIPSISVLMGASIGLAFIISLLAFAEIGAIVLGTISIGLVLVFFLWLFSVLPTTKIFYGEVFYRGSRTQKQIALTFDDGPEPIYTDQLLDLLDKENVKATFFLIGKKVKAHPEIVKKIVSQGHSVGNHSWSHCKLSWQKIETIIDELDKTQNIIAEVTGGISVLFRPPYGSRDHRVLHAARKRGLSTIMWSITTWDWENPGADKLFNKVRKKIKPGSILCFHDGSKNEDSKHPEQTILAVSKLISHLRSLDYTFLTIPEMISQSYIDSKTN
jgi:peptidoglycan-N-acetylglucosamine deacetylase